MSEEQGKPKWHWCSIGKILAAVVFIGVIIFMIVLISFPITPSRPPNCNGLVRVVESNVYYYSSYHNGSLPVLNGSYSNANCSSCHVINMSALLAENGGMLRSIPEGTWQGHGANDDNCDSSDGNSTGCSAANNYIWIVDDNGSIYSYCKGAGCKTNNSGYQGLLPWVECD